jgi:pimeloyl-ACP methyl ester carboxylesterase
VHGDTFEVDPSVPTQSEFDKVIFERVWSEAAEMRRDGLLLRAAAKVSCPVVAIHGSYDPHPADGVSEPLRRVLQTEFRWVLLEKCGHEPWIERHARAEFFARLCEQLA